AGQIRATRELPLASGNVLFSMKALLRNTGGVADALTTVYTEPALVPPSPWLGGPPPAKPAVAWQERDGRRVVQVRPAGEGVRLYIVRVKDGGRWTVRIQPADG